MNKNALGSILLLALLLTVIPFSSIAVAQPDDDKKFLLMYFKEEELVVESPTRGKKSLTQVAENITVITAEDIKLMNAHTIAEALNTVTGVQVFITGAPGSIAQASIQGSENRHVAVFMDGIPLNNLSDNTAELGLFPVQNIEKIEIIKGPASSAWGSSLGGVINIITKSGKEGPSGSTASVSYGSRNTGDFRAETSGKESGVGYYLTAGHLQTDGFRPHNDYSGNNAYIKLAYDLTNDTSVLFTLGVDQLSRGIVDLLDYDLFLNNDVKSLRSSLSFNSLLNQETEFTFSVWHMNQDFEYLNYQLSSGSKLQTDRYKDDDYGSSVKLAWKHQNQHVVIGADYNTSTLDSNTIAGERRGSKKWASYINDTISVDRMSITPGIRFDKTDLNGDFTSPSLGTTYKLTDATLLRLSASRGFSIPVLSATYGNNTFQVANSDLKMERVWSYQAGFESTSLNYLWLKMSLFKNDIRDIIVNEFISDTQAKSVNKGRARKQGLEVEMRTLPVFNTSLIAGAAFMNTRDLDTGQTMKNIPQRTYDVGIQFGNEKIFRALLIGHYIYWNSDPSYQGKYDSFLVDLNVDRTIFTQKDRLLEAFAKIHNITNATQYQAVVYKNPERWSEAGLRYAF